MNDWLHISSRGFWDVPRVFLLPYQEALLLFTSLFDEKLDDYSEEYSVHLLPRINENELPQDWTTLRDRAILEFDSIPVTKLKFDATKKNAVHRDVLKLISFQMPGQFAPMLAPNPVAVS